ncbi:hypothetical protein [Sphingomonas xinjiangensis]|uniref:Uncharacterized protein n=1 Tax=Sphingomonas xinjiangensis TaxID=643568 RepID=A0A840YLC8_9SPHN|nr:hypothetical protein [Sphingomonas xinjiangensis]MBB5710060.1 hypothetical protein [Sphingomonas xinjiangensis]
MRNGTSAPVPGYGLDGRAAPLPMTLRDLRQDRNFLNFTDLSFCFQGAA